MFKLKKEISIGELLTFVSIVGSAISVTLSWSSQRKITLRENENKIRLEAANTLGKVQRMKEIYLSFYETVQNDLVEVSEAYAQHQDNVTARDLLWKRLYLEQSEIRSRILNEQLETAYTYLLPFDRVIDSLYNNTLVRLKKINTVQFSLLLQDLEGFVLEYKSQTPKQSAIMGNELRKRLESGRQFHDQGLSKCTSDLEGHLKTLIDSPVSLLK